MRRVATIALTVLIIIVAAVYLPMLYDKLFALRVAKTHLLFSPVTKRFIYMEKIVGPVPPEARRKSEDHHAEIAYRDADGTYYTRVAFEKNLPFIYYKNMELWGLMPLRLEGLVFGVDDIRENRQVLELRPGDIHDRRPQTAIWPLLESNPGQARLVFPEDRFRMTDDAMVFVNADFNRVDPELTASFTRALKEKGFVFPCRSVNGTFTILKPFDEGIFLVDADYRVYHVKRRNDRPVVVRTPIAPNLRTRRIAVSENKRREYYGLLLAADDSLHLLAYDDYRLISLPLEDYDPDRMDFKLLVNPLYRTAVWSDETTIRAVAMDREYQPVDRYTHTMSRATPTPAHRIHALLFPFSIVLQTSGGEFLRISLEPGEFLSLIGMLVWLGAYLAVFRLLRRRQPPWAGIGLVALTGIYGLIAVTFIGSDV